MLEHLHHTEPKKVADHVAGVIRGNAKVAAALAPGGKRLLIWQTQPSLQ
jgi:hypothetical protein